MKKGEFFKILNNCVRVTYDDNGDNIYYIWNNDIDRLNKLSKILDQDIDIKNININININKDTDIYFEQDIKNKYLWCDYDKIWSKIESEYGTNYQEIIDLVKVWMKQPPKWEQYTPISGIEINHIKMKQPPKWEQYTPSLKAIFDKHMMEQLPK